MKRWLLHLLTALMFVASSAHAGFHMFQIEQLFSNADGSVKFVVLHEFTGSNDEQFLAGKALVSTRAGVNKNFTFLSNLPSRLTANKRALIGTQGFAALGVIAPDY